MNSNQSLEMFVECPFFLKLKTKSIICEGAIKGSDTAVFQFSNVKDRNSYIKNTCSVSGGRKCPYYKCVEKKYE